SKSSIHENPPKSAPDYCERITIVLTFGSSLCRLRFRLLKFEDIPKRMLLGLGLLNGTTALDVQLEQVVADFVGKPAAMITGMGYVKDSAILPVLIKHVGSSKICSDAMHLAKGYPNKSNRGSSMPNEAEKRYSVFLFSDGSFGFMCIVVNMPCVPLDNYAEMLVTEGTSEYQVIKILSNLYDYQMLKQVIYMYCFSCMRKHVEAKLLQEKLLECPHENCTSNLEIEICKKFLSLELYDIMSLRVKEASIPPTDKVYCPFSNCSFLMSKTELQEHAPASSSSTAARGTGMRNYVKCYCYFCINYKVPWHENFTCENYIRCFPHRSVNEAKLKSLATRNRWRECAKCKNLVELAEGCYHCRCITGVLWNYVKNNNRVILHLRLQ
ncbi:hypothetical protein M8C21_017235, partial [Ambrosia artemisiifolia]